MSIRGHPSFHTSHVTSPPTSPPPPRPASIDPITSLNLRIKWLEALVLGLKAASESKSAEVSSSRDLFHRAEEIQAKLNDALETNESYNQYAHLLSPAAATSPVGSSEIPMYDTMPDQEFETLLAELEPDIRAADRDLREIDALDSKGVSAAGKLPGKHRTCVLRRRVLGINCVFHFFLEHEALKTRLQALEVASQQDLEMYDRIEARISNILQSYASHVTILSELFVSWNDLLAEAEDRVEQLEKAKEERGLVSFKE
ncbi:hypothetical protein FRC04_003308 [Tulasnella sp. 424]|nr:hypothetical protein FRC04_003308 [Tulasnella sp. 424]KAG8965823.1 hypothetical protein FRC05_003004 [Tulasnella sp. 425]